MVHAATTTAGNFSSVFSAIDRDASGKISAAELRLCLKASLGLGDGDVSAEEAEALVASADADGDRLLDEEEFLRLMVPMRPAVTAGAEDEDEDDERSRGLKEAFRMYEAAEEGEAGRITAASLKRMLSRLGTRHEIDECVAMIRRFDLDGDGVVSFDEFKVMMEMDA